MSGEKTIPRRFRKQPVEVEAMRFTTNNENRSTTMDTIVNWVNQGRVMVGAWHNGTQIFINTLEGQMRVLVGDWIIRGVEGDFYLCKPDIFDATYEAVECMDLSGVLEGSRLGQAGEGS